MSLTAKEMFFEAASCGNTNLLTKYIDFMKLSRDKHGFTALMIAAANDRFEAVRLLAKFELKQFSMNGDTSLMIAAQRNAIESIKILKETEELTARNP